VTRTVTLTALRALTGKPWAGKVNFFHAADYSASVGPIPKRLRTDTLRWEASTGDESVTRFGRTPVDAVRVLLAALT